jgi:hypothetical protein
MKNTSPYHVIFEVLEINEKLQPGSTIEIGERFVGEYHPAKNSIFFEDVNNQEWWFKVGKNCLIILSF